LLLAICVVVVLFSLKPLFPENLRGGRPCRTHGRGRISWAYSIPLLVGLLVGPWLDLQHWQRAIQIHRENTSIRTSYIFGGLIFFLLLCSTAAWRHGCWASGGLRWMDRDAFARCSASLPRWTSSRTGSTSSIYAHQVVVQYIDRPAAETRGLLPAAYFLSSASAR
jgi:hypothetical protein